MCNQLFKKLPIFRLTNQYYMTHKMKTHTRLTTSLKLYFLLLISFFYTNTLYSQGKNKKDNLTVAEMTAQGNKVFVTANHQYTKEHAVRYLEEWGYWTVVKKREQADFVLQIISEPIMVSEHKAYAIINEPVSGKARYRTGTVNTIASISYHGRKAVVRRLIDLIRDTIEEAEGPNARVLY